MEYPKTKWKDGLSYLMESTQLELRKLNSSISEDEFNQALAELQQKYEGKVFRSDMHSFQTEQELRDFLSSVETPHPVDFYIQHEKQHADKARELGYEISYGSWLFDNHGQLQAVPFVDVKPKSADDYKQMAQAPEFRGLLDF